ncbi:hypothetical protein ACLKA6_001749 [Drosophila palustris]
MPRESQNRKFINELNKRLLIEYIFIEYSQHSKDLKRKRQDEVVEELATFNTLAELCRYGDPSIRNSVPKCTQFTNQVLQNWINMQQRKAELGMKMVDIEKDKLAWEKEKYYKESEKVQKKIEAKMSIRAMELDHEKEMKKMEIEKEMKMKKMEIENELEMFEIQQK